VLAAKPRSPLCRGCEHPGAEHHGHSCVPVWRGDTDGCRGSLHTARPLLSIMHHRDSPCPCPQVPAVGLAAWAPAPSYLHKLQVLEGGELPRDLSELVSIQVAARENESGQEAGGPSLCPPMHPHGLQVARSNPGITSLTAPRALKAHQHARGPCVRVPGGTVPAAGMCERGQPCAAFTHLM